MAWLQLHAHCLKSRLESVEALCTEAGSVSITLTDAGDSPILEPLPGEQRIWPEVVVTALFAADPDPRQALDTLTQQLADLTDVAVHVEPLEDRVWEREWMQDFKPAPFGERLWICPSGSHAPAADAIEIVLDPGLAFGTGSHPTTALCLKWLDGCDLTGKTVLDYGCGSGILAVAAAKLGAEHVFATDIDPQALTATGNNAAANKVGERIEIATELPGSAKQACDIVIANILAGTLIALADELIHAIKPGGRLALSGLLPSQAADVAAAFAGRIAFTSPEIEADWALLFGTQR